MNLKHIKKTIEVRYVSYIKYVRRGRDFIQPSHRHAVYAHEFIYVDYGEINVQIGNDSYLLKAGDAILIRGGCAHTFYGNEETPFSYFNSMFRGKVPDILFSKVIPVDQTARYAIERFINDQQQPSVLLEELICCHLTEIFVLFHRSLLLKERPSAPQIRLENLQQPFLPSGTSRRHSELAGKTLAIIRENFKHDLEMRAVAKSLNISASHLRALLKKETGKNFMTLLHEIRIEEAKRLLQDSTLTSSEIAGAVGYASPAFFFRVFKRFTGVTPKEYSSMLNVNNYQAD